MFITISRAHQYIAVLGPLRPAMLLFAFCVAYVVVVPRSVSWRNLIREWPSRAILTLVAVYFLSSMAGLSLGSSAAFFFDTFSRVLTLFVLLVACVRTVDDFRFFVSVYVASLLFVVWVTFFLGETLVFDGYTRVGGTATYDGNDLGVLYMIGLPLAVVMVRSGGRLVGAIGLLALIGIPASTALTASRGAFLALVSCGIGLLLLSPGVSVARRTVIVCAIAVSVAFAAPAGYWTQMSTITNLDQDYNVTSETGRVAIWKRGMGYVYERPLLGVGPNNFIRAGWQISDQARQGLGIRDQAAHNTFVQIWAEMGTLGFVLFTGILVASFRTLLRLRRSIPKAWLGGTSGQRFLYLMVCYLPVSIVGFTIAAFFVTHGYTPMYYVLVAFVGIVLTLVRRELRQWRDSSILGWASRRDSIVKN